MRLFLVALVLLPINFAISTNALALSKGSQENLKLAYKEYLELGVDLPFERIFGGWREKARELYVSGTRKLAYGLAVASTEPQNALAALKEARSNFRRVGLVTPFHEITTSKSEEVMARYLAGDDMIQTAILELEQGQAGPAPDPEPTPDPDPVPDQNVWRSDGWAWYALPKPVSLIEARFACGELNFENTSDWQVPTFAELARAFRSMKNPQLNPVFGTEAAGFGPVWTGEVFDPQKNQYQFINFVEEKSGVDRAISELHVVCQGKDLNRN